MNSVRPSESKSAIFALLFVAVACSLSTAWLWLSGRQLETLHYDQTPGRIVAISARDDGPLATDQDGNSVARAGVLKVRYDYTVAGKAYAGDRYRIASWPLSFARCDEYAGQHPARSVVNVYYDPHDPARAVLWRGLEGTDLFALLPVMLFCLGAAFLCAITWGRGELDGDRVATPNSNRSSGPHWGPVGMFGISLIVTAIASLGYLMLIRGDFDPSLETMARIWGVNLAGATVVYIAARLRSRRAGCGNAMETSRAVS